MVAVIPMAGRGTRYANQGYETPKPLIAVAGKPMVLWALQSIDRIPFSRYIIVGLREHEERYGVSKLIKEKIKDKVDFVWLDEVTQGQLCTVLAAKDLLDPTESILISSSDTLVESKIGEDIRRFDADGLISVANLPGEQWSFARTNDEGVVVEVAEKKRISDDASTGLYYFKKAGDLLRYGEEMIQRGETTRGEYYLIPVYQKLIQSGAVIKISKATAMWDMGTPEAKRIFEQLRHGD